MNTVRNRTIIIAVLFVAVISAAVFYYNETPARTVSSEITNEPSGELSPQTKVPQEATTAIAEPTPDPVLSETESSVAPDIVSSKQNSSLKPVVSEKRLANANVTEIKKQAAQVELKSKPKILVIQNEPISTIPDALVAPTPVAVVGGEKVSDPVAKTFVPGSSFVLGLQADYSSLTGIEKLNQTTGQLISKLNTGLKLQWQQHWSPDFDTVIYAGFRSVKFETDKRAISLLNSQLTTSFMGIGFQSNPERSKEEFARDFIWGLTAEYGEQLFYRGDPAGTGLELDAVPILKVHPYLRYTLFEKEPLSLFTEVGGSYYGSGSRDNYTIDHGYGYDVGLFVRQKFKAGSFQCGVFFNDRFQNTSLLKYTERIIGSRCQLAWGF